MKQNIYQCKNAAWTENAVELFHPIDMYYIVGPCTLHILRGECKQVKPSQLVQGQQQNSLI